MLVDSSNINPIFAYESVVIHNYEIESEMTQTLYIAIDAAIKAGVEIMKIYNDPTSDFGIEKKADNSPLTIADKNANEVICSILEETKIPILSEEGKTIDFSTRNQWKKLWIVDPLDGTKEFIKRNGEFTVNIALVENSTPILGVIYVPVKRELYFGCIKTGAFKYTLSDDTISINSSELETKAIRLPIKKDDGQFVVVASRSHLSEETESYIEKLRHIHHSINLISSGSSLKICLVAEGKADVYPRFAPTMEWDTAAGHAIASAAGMEIFHTDETTPLRYNKEDLLNPWFIVKKNN